MGDSFVAFLIYGFSLVRCQEKFIEKCMQIRYAKPKIVA